MNRTPPCKRKRSERSGIVTVTGLGRLEGGGRDWDMTPPPDPHYRHRFPAEIISHAVWLYHVFSLSLRDVELILAERGVVVSYETVRRWCKKFAASFANRLRRRRPRARRQVAHGRSLYPDPGRAALSLAGGGLAWRCARHPGSGPS